MVIVTPIFPLSSDRTSAFLFVPVTSLFLSLSLSFSLSRSLSFLLVVLSSEEVVVFSDRLDPSEIALVEELLSTGWRDGGSLSSVPEIFINLRIS